MKLSKTILWSFILLIAVCALYRVIPGRPYGFAPQWAMAVFAGFMIRDKKFAFIIPVLSMFFSDMFYQILYVNGLSDIPGFYDGQWQNYLLFALLPLVSLFIRKVNVVNIAAASLAAPTVYFLLSNFLLWASPSGNRGLDRPHTFSGLIQCYNDAIPFYRTSLWATLVFSAILFGAYYLLQRNAVRSKSLSSH